ncbi:hypothetical protein COOONC_20187 [Cooperia oncophora]
MKAISVDDETLLIVEASENGMTTVRPAEEDDLAGRAPVEEDDLVKANVGNDNEDDGRGRRGNGFKSNGGFGNKNASGFGGGDDYSKGGDQQGVREFYSSGMAEIFVSSSSFV